MAQQAKLEDSNVANTGSAAHRDAQRDAAESVDAFRGAGESCGVEVWRIVAFGAERWPRKLTGTFHRGDSYIVLYTYQEKGSEAKKYRLHFWIGESSTQDEYATAAYLTVALDDLLGDAAVQYRECSGYESVEFRRLFPRMQLLEGGADSGFNAVKPTEYRPRLLHVKGSEYVQVRQVPLSARSLNAGDCFVLDGGLRLTQWNAPGANPTEKRSANELVASIKDERNGKPSSAIVDGLEAGPDADAFWEQLGGGRPAELAPATDDNVSAPRRVLYRLSDASGDLRFEKVAEGVELGRELLSSDDAFIVDTGVTVFAWVGRGASDTERKEAMRWGMKYLDDEDRPMTTPLVRVVEGGTEPAALAKAFDAPPPDPPAAGAGAGGRRLTGFGRGRGGGAGGGAGGFEGMLTVTAHGAKELRNVQKLGKQDPYLEVRVGKQRFRSSVHKDGVDEADWHGEVFKAAVEPDQKEVRVKVRNENLVLDAGIGEARLPLDEVVRSSSFAQRWFPLEHKGEPAGQVSLTVTFTAPFVVTAVRAEGLLDVQKMGKQDPFVVARAGDVKRKGGTHDNGGTAPTWDDSRPAAFNFNLGLHEPDDDVTFEVWNANVVSDTKIGGGSARAGDLIRAANQEPIAIELRGKDDKACGKLYLRVTHKQ